MELDVSSVYQSVSKFSAKMVEDIIGSGIIDSENEIVLAFSFNFDSSYLIIGNELKLILHTLSSFDVCGDPLRDPL
jgi:hypothetical protein